MKTEGRELRLFLWGVSTSSHQIEGNNIHNDWWRWEQQSEGALAGPSGVACHHRQYYRDDIQRVADLGCNSYRFSVEWSRVEPERGRWDEDELAWYSELVDICLERGIEPMLTLHHFTVPRWFADRGGFAEKSGAGDFLRYGERLVEIMKGRVKLWCTFNEPMAYACGAYLGRFMPPAEWAPKKFSNCCRNLMQIHGQCFDLIKERCGPEAQVGLAKNFLAFRPRRPWSPVDRFLSFFADSFYNMRWIRFVTGNRLDFQIPISLGKRRTTVDFIGVNYYTKAVIGYDKSGKTGHRLISNLPLMLNFCEEGDQLSALGWAVYPEGFEEILKKLRTFGLPIIVTENGIATHGDELREKYIIEHLSVIEGLRAEGHKILGYYHWSLLDNFEWMEGYGPRFGLYEVDFRNQQRSPRDSAKLYRSLIELDRAKRAEGENRGESL